MKKEILTFELPSRENKGNSADLHTISVVLFLLWCMYYTVQTRSPWAFVLLLFSSILAYLEFAYLFMNKEMISFQFHEHSLVIIEENIKKQKDAGKRILGIDKITIKYKDILRCVYYEDSEVFTILHSKGTLESMDIPMTQLFPTRSKKELLYGTLTYKVYIDLFWLKRFEHNSGIRVEIREEEFEVN